MKKSTYSIFKDFSHFLLSLTSRQKATVSIGFLITLLSAVLHAPGLVGSLVVALVVTHFSKQLTQITNKLSLKIKFWQIAVAILVASLFVALQINPASAQLFNPLQGAANNALTQAGASAVSGPITSIFGIMNILVTIAGIGAVVYGGYQQSQGHTLRESFTPLATIIMVFVGCNVVMRVFLGTTT